MFQALSHSAQVLYVSIHYNGGYKNGYSIPLLFDQNGQNLQARELLQSGISMPNFKQSSAQALNMRNKRDSLPSIIRYRIALSYLKNNYEMAEYFYTHFKEKHF